MKLATLKNNTLDGQLVIVSTDLSRAVSASAIAPNLLSALQDWDRIAPRLQQLAHDLNAGRVPGAQAFDPRAAAAPLPRAPQWLDASAFHSHGDLLEKVLNKPPLPTKHDIPLMYQGASDDFLGAHDDVVLPSEDDGIDFEAELGVIVDDIPMAIRAVDVTPHIKLLTLINDMSLRNLAGYEVKTGFGFLQAKSSSSFAPVVVTPDEISAAWHNGRVHLPVNVYWNEREFGHPSASEMAFSYEQLVAHAARTRRLRAGSIIGSGTISNYDFRNVGSACIAERRGIEKVDSSPTTTPYMKFGDRVRIEVRDSLGNNIFGSIDQRIVQLS